MKRILVNFTNPYVFYEHILHNLYNLKRNSDVEIYIVLTNYFIPIHLEQELVQMKDEGIIVDFVILNIYTSKQMPKGRRIAFITPEFKKILALKQNYLKQNIDLLILETTNELMDLLFLVLNDNENLRLCLLKPVGNAPVVDNTSKSTIKPTKIPSMLLIKSLLYLEKIERSFVFFFLAKKLITPRRWPEIHEINRVADLIVTSEEVSLSYLKQNFYSKKFVISSFIDQKNFGAEELNRSVLILLPFSGTQFDKEFGNALKTAILKVERSEGECKLKIRPHPRSNPDSITSLILQLELGPKEFEITSLEKLGNLIEASSIVILSEESSTLDFLSNNYPEKNVLVIEKNFRIKDQLSRQSDTLRNSNLICFEIERLLEIEDNSY